MLYQYTKGVFKGRPSSWHTLQWCWTV